MQPEASERGLAQGTATSQMEARRLQEHQRRMLELASRQELILNIETHRPSATKRAYSAKQLEFYVGSN